MAPAVACISHMKDGPGIIASLARNLPPAKAAIKLCALLLGFASLVVALIDARGGFTDSTRRGFAQEILVPEKVISPTTRGFREFFGSFPVAGVALADVVKLRRDRVNSHDGFPITLTVRYVLKGDKVTGVVADKSAIDSWATKSTYGLWSLLLAFAMFICVAFLDIPEVARDWKAKRKKVAGT